MLAKRLLLLHILLLIMMILASCSFYPSVDYSILDQSGNYKLFLELNNDEKEKFGKTGEVIYLGFFREGNDFYWKLCSDILTRKEFHELTVHKIEFSFEDRSYIEALNFSTVVNLEKVDYYKNLTISEPLFHAYFNEIPKVRIYLNQIFKKHKQDFGKSFKLTINVYYSFDSGNINEQSIDYIVTPCAGWDVGPTWLHRLFPEM